MPEHTLCDYCGEPEEDLYGWETEVGDECWLCDTCLIIIETGQMVA
ncbi:hypothetical protein LCGC14_2520270 [marine sediment metagenome]|uniref:ClpX-type ZB domain-containing protein n=1 Tax=marine sediment metagenome TaxID=412755 RepID=A0A0F9BJK4_9ZZZZ